ncbi:MAG: hypothetical protein CL775_00615 [Chloroflexi bacterium]|nr:hypothetical protein [Chloroflexota bacterium]|tara:strand:- start:650 stop:1711 length:1062 start_codon:yes stop_codon:yes gene_type:complete
MKALLYYGNKDIRLEEIEKPKPKSNEVLVKVKYTSLCATDIEEWQYGPLWIQTTTSNPLSGKKAPLVMGHEISGVVDSVGDINYQNLIGTRVVINNVLTCGKCYWCQSGHHAVCPSMAVAGLSADGGLQEYMVWPIKNIIPVPDSISDEEISLLEPATIAVHAVRKSGIKPGDIAVVVGCGTVGLLTLQTLMAAGAIVIAVDIKQKKLNLAKKFGATNIFKVEKNISSLYKQILSITNNIGPDYVFETAGAEESPELSVNIARRGGTIILVGIYSQKPMFDFNQIVSLEKKVIGSVAAENNDMKHAVNLVSKGTIKLKPLITETIKLSNVIEDGFKKMLDGDKEIFRIIVKPD